MAGAPIGNTNAAKAKIWSDAIRKAVMRVIKDDPEDRKKIDALADRIVEAGLDGDIAALKEIGDRLEGKAVQATTVANEDGSPLLTGITVTFINPSNPDASGQ